MLASCKEDFKDWANPQSSEAGSEIEAVTLSLNAPQSIDLDKQTGETVTLFTPSLNAGAYAESYGVTLTAGEKTVNMEADASGAVSVDALNKAIIALYDRVRVEREVKIEAITNADVMTSAGVMSIAVSGSTSTKIMVQTTNFKEFLYLVGGDTNWSGNYILQSKDFDGKYVGYGYLSQDFKFRPNADNWDDDIECQGDGKLGEGGSNCPAPEVPGLHKIEVDLEAMTYKITNFGVVSLIGGAIGGWNEGDDVDMEYSAAEGCYVVTTDLAADSFKFRTDHAWNSVNWGGSDVNKLEIDKDNCSVAEAGTYIVRFWPSYSGNGRYEIEAL